MDGPLLLLPLVLSADLWSPRTPSGGEGGGVCVCVCVCVCVFRVCAYQTLTVSRPRPDEPTLITPERWRANHETIIHMYVSLGHT